MSRRGPCADCDPSTASTASVSSDLHKYHVACTCGGVAQYAECASVGPPDPPTSGPGSIADIKEPRPPALPPRPPPRPRPRNGQGGTIRSDVVQSSGGSTSTSNIGVGSGRGGVGSGSGPKKYVWWCLGMGTAACLLGGLLLAAAMLLRAHTDSLHHLETIPTPVPASMLVATGLCIMSLARRRNRYSYLIKVVGACCLVCALTCVLVTITTTVIHMNRLQTLRKCVYTEKTKTCTCYSILTDGQNIPGDEEDGVKCVFESVMDCGTIHGALYRCLGAVFGLSVAGVLVCICSAMLAYQLLSHERKKMYWEQLELRCRSLYRPTNNGNTGGTTTNQQADTHPQQPPVCDECCAECRAAAAVSWDIQHRFWASGRVGNLYSPNPGTGRRVSPWSWFPWTRNSNQRVGGSTSGDSAYGFGNNPAGYWQLGPPPPYTPHHRYLHHHIQQQQAAAAANLHHHHMQSANNLNLGMPAMAPGATGTLGSRHRGPQHTRRSCDTHQHATVSEDFSEEMEEMHQHTCQNYQHAGEQGEPVVIQGTENLAFQCDKQFPQRQARSGESELYFADVSSCCNGSLKTVEYCGGGLVGTIDSQGESSSGESDGQQNRHHRKGHHAQGMGACSQSPRRPKIKNSNLQHSENRLHGRPCEINCRSNLMLNSRGELHYIDGGNKDMCQRSAGGFHCDNPECTQMLTCAGDPSIIRNNEMLRRISENNEELESPPTMQCSLNGSMCQNSGNFNSCLNTPERMSMRIKQSPNRSSFICRQQSPIRANCVGLPTNSPNSFPMKESETFGNSQMRRRDSREENLGSYGGTSSSLAQIRRRNDEDCGGRRQALDNSCTSYNNKRKPIDENLLNEDARKQVIEDTLLNNSLEVRDECSMASIRKTLLEESILNCSVKQTISALLNNSHEDQNDSQIMKRKPIDESMFCGEETSFSPIRRKDLEDSLTKEQISSMSPLRRRILEDSINNELNISLSSMRRKPIEDTINNELSSSTPVRWKGDEPNTSHTRGNKREDSMSSDDLDVSVSRRKVNNDSLSNNNEQNSSMSPLHRRVLEEKINNECANISLTRKAIEDLNNENQTKALDDLLNNDPTAMARRKGIDEILNSQLDTSAHNLKSNLSQMMQSDYNNKYNGVRDLKLEDALTNEIGGSRRGIIERSCLGPDVRYEPVQIFGNECVGTDDVGTQNSVHLRCCSDSNTMDSGWQSGSEKHITD